MKTLPNIYQRRYLDIQVVSTPFCLAVKLFPGSSWQEPWCATWIEIGVGWVFPPGLYSTFVGGLAFPGSVGTGIRFTPL